MTAAGQQAADQIVEDEVRELVRRRGLDPGHGDAVAVRQLIEEVVADYAERRLVAAMPPLPDAGQVAKAVADRVIGMGPLQPFFDDPDVEEIWINEPGKVFVAKAGRPQLTTTVLSEEHVHDLVELMLRASGRRVDLSSPFVDATIGDGSRLHVVIPDITRRHWVVNIRRFVLRAHSLAELVRLGTMSGQCARFLEAAVVTGLNIVVAGGTGNAWANPRPVETPRRLVLEGGFAVDGGRDRRLQERAGALGYDELRAYLQARCDAGYSIPRIATELGVSDWQVQAALARLAVWLAPRPQRLAQQRRRHTEERIAAGVAALGFADVRAYLADRVTERAWLLAEVAAELAAHRLTVRRLLDRHGIRRVRRTPAERAAADVGRRVQAVGWQARRAARLTELGFEDLATYLRARQVEQGWSVKRMRAELGVGRRWLVGEMRRLGLRP
jgi:hypothetical protein